MTGCASAARPAARPRRPEAGAVRTRSVPRRGRRAPSSRRQKRRFQSVLCAESKHSWRLDATATPPERPQAEMAHLARSAAIVTLDILAHRMSFDQSNASSAHCVVPIEEREEVMIPECSAARGPTQTKTTMALGWAGRVPDTFFPKRKVPKELSFSLHTLLCCVKRAYDKE